MSAEAWPKGDIKEKGNMELTFEWDEEIL